MTCTAKELVFFESLPKSLVATATAAHLLRAQNLFTAFAKNALYATHIYLWSNYQIILCCVVA